MDPTERLDLLEIRLTEQEATVEDLNRIVTEQWQQIDRLTRLVMALREQVEEATARSAQRGPEPPPPHY
ncbi:SlyX family protein [Methylobacterium persicinum]|uniref:Protein SlyX homolog n=1 Tax=Methylobacterium persicinum TaxID=374426 RepID=A0ABU0HHB8_9HYPH|nr:SlyX family protein [Methylobacterium persicinum]MDQ0441690.1 SlyX protein [Methylobacterium persicinum]GJE39451.1 Protein SlyX [Methylobacterium persicinum]